MTGTRNQTKGPRRRGSGFVPAGRLVQPQIQKVGKQRGFAVSRLLTHWSEVVGQDVAALCQPVKVAYGRGGLGATLTVLARGAAGPMLQAQLATLRDKVNACYGYNAVARIRITQTAPAGFAEPASAYTPPVPAESRDARTKAAATTAEIADPELRATLADLGARIMSKSNE